MSDSKDAAAAEKVRIDGTTSSEDEIIVATDEGIQVNASGHKDQLSRQYGLLGLAGIALTVDNAWVALGSSISVSIREYLHSPAHPPLASTLGSSRVDRRAPTRWRGRIQFNLHYLLSRPRLAYGLRLPVRDASG